MTADDPAVLGAIHEIADARLFEDARRSSRDEIVGTIVPNRAGPFLQLAANAREVAPQGTWIRLAVDGETYFGLVQKIAINRICDATDGPDNVATEVLVRASEAGSLERARGRRIRLVPSSGGGFDLELCGQ